jgi:hypothetical protein
LAKIEEAAEAGRWQAAEIGLARWLEVAGGYLDNDGKIAGVFKALLARRDELVGRLSARRAQAKALAARGAGVETEGQADAEKAANDAADALARRPTPLARAVELVDRYERLLRRPI